MLESIIIIAGDTCIYVLLQVISNGNLLEHQELVFTEIFDGVQYFLKIEVNCFIVLNSIQNLIAMSPVLISWQFFTLASKLLVLTDWIYKLITEELHQVWYIS